MAREKQDLFRLFPADPSIVRGFFPTVPPAVTQRRKLYLPFGDFVVGWQIPVGCFYEQMAMRNT